jgi:hypothetical protein
MRFMALIYSDESADIQPGDPGWDALMADYGAFTQELQRSNAFVMGERLEDTEQATTIRLQDGKPVILDGPFAETKEALGGFYIFDCASMEEAASLAPKIPSAKNGSVEVRQLFGHDDRHFDRMAGRAYMILLYGEESKFLPPGDPAMMAGLRKHRELTERAIADGAYLDGDALHLTKTAVTLRVRDGEVLRTDGPFAETKEQLGGFYLLGYPDLDTVIEFAKELPLGVGCHEIRPLPPRE